MAATEHPVRRILSIDGGGIRGVIALEILIAMEDRLRERGGHGPAFVLADYFHYMAGTSTGAIIASALAIGLPARSIRTLFEEHGRRIFSRVPWWRLLYSRYTHRYLAATLQRVFGPDTTLGSDRLRTFLMLTMRNASTDSPWFLSNAPGARFNQRELDGCNLDVPLWQLVRASTAAPTYFVPEEVQVGSRRFVFEDGGMTTFNNPAFQAYLMATLPEYGVGWPVGEDRLQLVSVGTGQCDLEGSVVLGRAPTLLHQAQTAPLALLSAADAHQDLLCRVVGCCRFGGIIDGEVGDLRNRKDRGFPPHFAYWRFNPDLSRGGLDALGLEQIASTEVQALDGVERMKAMQAVGATFATRAGSALDLA